MPTRTGTPNPRSAPTAEHRAPTRWSWAVAVPALAGSAQMMIGGLTGMLAAVGLARPRTGAYATDALGRLAIGVWAPAVAGVVVGQAVQARRRSSAGIP
ncbi:hypothetical protein AB0K48_37000 [Nonomuraea sp. NPDC055795]